MNPGSGRRYMTYTCFQMINLDRLSDCHMIREWCVILDYATDPFHFWRNFHDTMLHFCQTSVKNSYRRPEPCRFTR